MSKVIRLETGEEPERFFVLEEKKTIGLRPKPAGFFDFIQVDDLRSARR
jgi:hypothetical protein